MERDNRKEAALKLAGWRVIVVWECELRQNLQERLELLCDEIVSPSYANFLSGGDAQQESLFGSDT